MSKPEQFTPILNIIDINPKLIQFFKTYLKHFAEIEATDETKKVVQVKLSDYITCNTGVIDITKLKNSHNTAFVSAANGEGFLGGGVDNALRSMFPKVQPIIRETIIENGYINGNDEQFIPVGSATIVPVSPNNNFNQYLITSPTMLSPMDVSTTENCYYALYATLRLVKKFNESLKKAGKPQIDKIFCPGLGTGVGGMSSNNAAKQFVKAIIDFILIDLLCVEKPTTEQEIYFTDISTNDNCFLRAPRQFIMSQPHWKNFMRKRKPFNLLLNKESDVSDENLAAIMANMSDAEIASNFLTQEHEQSNDSNESNDDDIENFVLRPSKGTGGETY
jgi:O-acetyl-ADP-ribose deacetylase (regulator of RNase III)